MITRRQFVKLASLPLLGASFAPLLGGCSNLSANAAGLVSSEAASTAGASGSAASAQNAAASSVQSLDAFLFDTIVSVQATCSDTLMKQVEKRLVYFENIFSKTVAGSDVDLINTAAGDPIEVHPETAEVINAALQFSEASDGLFDITIGGVVALWDFKEGVVPSEEDLAAALAHVGYHNIVLEGTTVQLTDPLTQIDLGAIAKGYIADDIAALLRENGCESALINLGGNTYALGTKPDGSLWNVGLQDPNEAHGATFGSVRVQDKSVVASGINERSFEKDGVRYHHLLDPRTGMPANNGLASVTIVSDSSLEGDASTTTCFLMGGTEGTNFVQAHDGIEAIFMATDGTRTQTAGIHIESSNALKE